MGWETVEQGGGFAAHTKKESAISFAEKRALETGSRLVILNDQGEQERTIEPQSSAF